jgi:hypothetical protein
MAGQDLEESKKLLRDYVTRIGDEIKRVVDPSVASANVEEVFVCQHGTHIYHAIVLTDMEYVVLRYPFSVDETYAAQRAVKNGIEPENLDITQDMLQRARRVLDNNLDEVSNNDLRDLRTNIIQALSKEGCAVELDTTESVYIHGFNIDKKIYLQDGSFSVSDFDYAAQTVVNFGWVGKTLLADAYNLTGISIIEDETTTEQERPGFQ